MKIIEIRELSKQINEKKILDNITLEIDKKRYGVVGQNGSGKTTLLRILSTQLAPTSGTCTLLGYDIIEDRDKIRGRIGALTEKDYFYGNLTLRENLELFSKLSGAKEKRVSGLIQKLGLEAYENTEFSNLSSGISRLCRFCKAIMNKPDLLILDEPFASLDAENAKKVRNLIDKNSKYVVMSAHSPALGMFSAYCILEKGRVTANEHH